MTTFASRLVRFRCRWFLAVWLTECCANARVPRSCLALSLGGFAYILRACVP